MHLIIGKVDGHIKEKNGSKYLVFDSTYENKEVLKKTTKLWNGIKNEIEIINGGKKRWIWQRFHENYIRYRL